MQILALFVVALASFAATAQDLDVDILNFALNLEYLEANFYSCAAFGKPLMGDMINGGEMARGCPGHKALISAPVLALATEIANDEIAHVKFLLSALGPAAVPQPRINIGTAFTAAANAAFGQTVPFRPYANDITFLMCAFIFEDVGVTAYKGAAPLVTNKDYLGAAAGILAVEAYHAGAIRATLLAIQNKKVFATPAGADPNAFPYSATVAQGTAGIAALRASVDGIGMDDFGILVDGKYVIAPVDKNSIAFSRAPVNVLPIVYLGGTASGGFFPAGLNGSQNNTGTALGR